MRWSAHALASVATSALMAALLVQGSAEAGTDHAASTPRTAQATPRLSLDSLDVAQTHVIEAQGRAWTPVSGPAQRLTLSGARGALVLARFSQSGVKNPALEVWRGRRLVATLDLRSPQSLPPTEKGGPSYAARTWWIALPGRYVAPGLKLSATAPGFRRSVRSRVAVGADTTLRLRVLPFYLFGATPRTVEAPWSSVRDAAPAVKADLRAAWPISRLQMGTHPASRVVWPNLVVAPRNDGAGLPQPAYVVHGLQQQRDDYAAMSSVLTILNGIRAASGEGPTNTQYYAPVLGWDTAADALGLLAGGLGGGGSGVGDEKYAGVFLHEQGHAFGLGHAGAEYDAGGYPYPGGSLQGSSWGYDAAHQTLLSPKVAVGRQSRCLTGHVLVGDGPGCWKQDPMQGGSGDQAAPHRYTMFSDFNAARIQRWLQGGPTVRNDDGSYTYDGGRVFLDDSSPTGFARWNSLSRSWDPVSPTTESQGINGPDGGLAVRRDLPVASVVLTRSNALSAGATKAYPPLEYVGDAVRTFDPTTSAGRAAIDPDGTDLAWYCRGTGCDYTARVTLADGTVKHVVLQGAFRPWWQWTSADKPSSVDPLSPDSQRTWVVNVRTGGAKVTRIELLSTPQAWTATAQSVAAAPVLATWAAG